MRILLTGALGHIGSYLMRHLPEASPGAELVLIDNFRTQRFASLFFLPQDRGTHFIEADVATDDLAGLVREADTVIHLAAITDATASLQNPDEVVRNNLTATDRIAQACARSGVPLIALSTTSVYGPQSSMVAENCEPNELAPQSPYAEVKLREEELLVRLSAEAGLRVVICRFGTIFGPSPGMRFHTAVNRFCWQAVMRQPLTVWTTAYDQKRPYLDLRDASRMLAFLIDREIFDGSIYNVVTVNATVRQIVDVIRSFVPDIEIELTDSPLMNQLSYEVSRARSEALGFTYTGDLRSGIGETIAMLRGANTLR